MSDGIIVIIIVNNTYAVFSGRSLCIIITSFLFQLCVFHRIFFFMCMAEQEVIRYVVLLLFQYEIVAGSANALEAFPAAARSPPAILQTELTGTSLLLTRLMIRLPGKLLFCIFRLKDFPSVLGYTKTSMQCSQTSAGYRCRPLITSD